MLLHIVSLTRDIAVYHTSCTQSNSRRLALSRVRLLWLRDADFQAHALKLWCAGCRHGWRGLFTCALGLAAAIGDLVECCEDGGCGGEGADWGEGGGGERGDGWAVDRWRKEAPY